MDDGHWTTTKNRLEHFVLRKAKKKKTQEGHWPWGAHLRLMFCVQNTSKVGFD